MRKPSVEYFEGNQIVMGASCVGKGQRPEPRKSDNKSNTLSSEMQSNEDVLLQHSKEIRLPVLTLTPHRPLLLPMPAAFKLPSEKPHFQKEYRYQELFEFRTENRFISSCSITQFTEKRVDLQSKEEKWSQCSTLERQLYDPATLVLVNGNAYIKSALPQQSQQIPNKMQHLSETEIQIHLEPHLYPKQLLLISTAPTQEGSFHITHKCYEISHHEDIQIIVKDILETHPQFEYFHTPFLNGVVFSHPTHPNQHAEPHFLTEMFAFKHTPTLNSVFMFYKNSLHLPHTSTHRIQKGKLTKYFEIAHLVKEQFGDIWHCSIQQLGELVEGEKLDAFLAVQFLKCLIDSLERQFLTTGKYSDKREELCESRTKIIYQFLMLDSRVLRLMHFLINTFLIFQTETNLERNGERIKSIEKAIACQLTTICDGLFHQFGYEVNQKEHNFKLEAYYFLKNKNQKKTIRHIYKNAQLPHSSLITRIKSSLMQICSSSELREELIDAVRQEFMKEVEQSYKEAMANRINVVFVQDFLMRLKLLQFYLSILAGKINEGEWKQIQDHISQLQYTSPETILFYFTLGGLASTALKPNIDRTQAEEFYYLKALELAHKIYGDPRANRSSIPIEQQQVWQLLILENYSSLFKGSFEKKEFHYLNNISECLREDVRSFFPDPEVPQEGSQKNLARMIQYLPIRTLSGHFYLRSMVFDAENEELRSNYSQSLSSSSSSKRTNRASYKINESEFSLKLAQHSGIIRWGHSIAGPPHILPPFKNKQVIAISSGNYHTIFLTQGGVFGWGENHSCQLGSHNKEKVYLKETVCVKSMPINRHKDRYQVSCGNQHSAVLINGTLYMWGQAEGGILAGNGYIFDMVSCGGLHTLAIREGVVYSWGRGQGGQLGHPLSTLNQKKKEETTQFFIDTPLPIRSIPASVIKVACGDAHSLVLTSEGKVYVFGFCYQGQLGLGLTGENETFQVFQPLEQSFFKERIIDIFAGPTFSFFKTEKEEVYSCGMNDCLQLGIDRVLKVFQKKKYLNRTIELNRRKLGQQEFSRPRKIDMFGGQFGVSLLQLECGENHCLALVRYMGQEVMMMGWGLNRHFQIESALPESTTPRTLDAFYSLPIAHICCGSTYSLANIGNISMTDQELERLLSDAHVSANRL